MQTISDTSVHGIADGEAPARPRRRGRAARIGDATVTPPVPAQITRRLPTFDPLGEESLVRLEAAADTLLEEIGIEFRGDDEALSLWRGAGADVDGVRVRFPDGLLRSLIATAPRRFTQHARNPARSVEIGGDAVVFAPAYGPPFVRDLDGGRRYGTIGDFERFVKLAYALPSLHHSGGTVCEPVDLPVNKRHLDMTYAPLRWSDKALMGAVTAPERAEDSIEMCRVAFGADFVDRNCVLLANINVNSPLVYDGVMSRTLRAYAAANQCAIVVPFILGGAMAPVTMPAAIAQAHAETLAGIALTQLVRPGAPVIYGNFLSSTSLRTGAPTFGTPEPALASLVVGQLARRLGLPLRCSGAFTSAKLADAQAATESAMAMQAAALCGANFVLHAAGWLEAGLVMSYEKMIMDADLLSALHVYLEGMRIDDDQLALDAFREVGPGKHFFGCAHTLAHFQNAYWESRVSDVASYEQWRDDGEKTQEQRAADRCRTLLDAYEAPPIDPGTDEALCAFVRRRKESVPDAWH